MDYNAFDALLERAHASYQAGYLASGRLPDHFSVTDEEYRLLLRSDAYRDVQQAYPPDAPMRLLGMVVCHRHAWCPEMAALQQCADAYATRRYRETGHRPQHWHVTSSDYELLVRHVPDDGGIHLWGMRVYPPERMFWSRGASSMRHIHMRRPIPFMRVDAPIPIMTDMAAQTCSTLAPRHFQHEVVCPCGEVIWDLSTYTHGLDMARQDAERSKALSLDSELTPMDDWEVGVRRMIAEARRHHGALPRSGG